MALSVKNMLGGGGKIDVANGKIEELKAIDNIEKNNFVEIVRKGGVTQEWQEIVSPEGKYFLAYSSNIYCGTHLDDGRFLLMANANTSYNSAGSKYYWYIVSFNEDGSYECINSGIMAGTTSFQQKLVKLSDNRVAIVYSDYGTMHAYILKIEGNTITSGANVTLGLLNSMNTLDCWDIALVSDNNIAIVGANQNYTYGMLFSVNDITPTLITENTRLAYSPSSNYTNLIPTNIPNTAVICTWKSSSYPVAYVCDFSNMSYGSILNLSTAISITVGAKNKVDNFANSNVYFWGYPEGDDVVLKFGNYFYRLTIDNMQLTISSAMNSTGITPVNGLHVANDGVILNAVYTNSTFTRVDGYSITDDWAVTDLFKAEITVYTSNPSTLSPAYSYLDNTFKRYVLIRSERVSSSYNGSYIKYAFLSAEDLLKISTDKIDGLLLTNASKTTEGKVITLSA